MDSKSKTLRDDLELMTSCHLALLENLMTEYPLASLFTMVCVKQNFRSISMCTYIHNIENVPKDFEYQLRNTCSLL